MVRIQNHKIFSSNNLFKKPKQLKSMTKNGKCVLFARQPYMHLDYVVSFLAHNSSAMIVLENGYEIITPARTVGLKTCN